MEKLIACSLVILLVLGAECLTAFLVMLGLNWLLPQFGVVVNITFPQALVGLLLLSLVGSLFKK